VVLNRRTRIRNALEYSRAATCRDFACGIREIGRYFARSRKTGSNWLKRSQSDRAFFSNHDDEAESPLSRRLKWQLLVQKSPDSFALPGKGGADRGQGAAGHL
jgi:hypothetical protein